MQERAEKGGRWCQNGAETNIQTKYSKEYKEEAVALVREQGSLLNGKLVWTEKV